MLRHVWQCALVPALVASAAVAETWVPLGPEGGRITAVAVDPDDPDVAYAVGQYSAFRRAGRDAAWQRLPLDFVTRLAVAPGGRVYFAGYGQVFHSADHGVTFAETVLPVAELVDILAVDPSDATRLYAVVTRTPADAAPESTLLAGSDGGRAWQTIGPVAIHTTALAVDPGDGERLYLAAAGAPLQVSEDGGRTWADTAAAPPCPPGEVPAGELEGCVQTLLARPDALLAGTFAHGVLRSVDGGATWQAVSEAVYVESLTAIPATAIVYAAGATSPPGRVARPVGRVLRSDDGGASWESLPGELPATVAMVAAIEDGGAHLLAATGSRDGFAGNGLFASRDAGASWQPDQAGLDATCVRSLAIAATPMTTLHAALGNHTDPLVATRDGGTMWIPADLGGPAEVVAVAVDSNDPLHVVAAAGFHGIFVSRDGGVTWTERGLDGWRAEAVAIDAHDGDTLYIVGPENGLARSRDGGESYEIVLRAEYGLWDVAVDEAGSAVYTTAYDAVHASHDGGSTWERILAADMEGFGSLAVAPTEPPTVYVTSSAGLRISDDGGRRWRLASVGDPQRERLTGVRVDPSRALTVYAHGFDVDSAVLYRSDDGGRRWRAVVDPPASTYALAVDPHDRDILYAATCGAGVQMLAQGTTAAGGGDHDGCAVSEPATTTEALAAHLLALAALALFRRRRDEG